MLQLCILRRHYSLHRLPRWRAQSPSRRANAHAHHGRYFTVSPPLSLPTKIHSRNTNVFLASDCSYSRGIYPGSKQLLEEFVRFVKTKGLRPHIDRVFSFEETPEAIEYLGKGQHIGKIVVKVVSD